MGWVVLSVWIGAVVLAVAVLGFCAYELNWKRKRLAGDVRDLERLRGPLGELQVELAAAQARLAEAERRLGEAPGAGA